MGSPAEVVQWDVTSLPLRDACVDAVVTDLPFGKRVGSRLENRELYPAALREVRSVYGICVRMRSATGYTL